MRQDNIPVTIQLLDKDYRIACKDGEQETLIASARYLDMKMREIRSKGNVIGTDRIAVMAALNMAHELLGHKTEKEQGTQALGKRIHALQEKVEAALNSAKQLEL